MKGGDRSLGRAEHCSLDHSPEVFFSASASLFASKYMDVCVSVFFFRLKAKFRGLDRGNGALEQDVKSTYVYCICQNIENVYFTYSDAQNALRLSGSTTLELQLRFLYSISSPNSLLRPHQARNKLCRFRLWGVLQKLLPERAEVVHNS